MRFDELVRIVGNEPVFDTGLLLAGAVDPRDVRRQLSRWHRAGRVYRLRRERYALAPPYQKGRPHPFVVANRLVPASYVSLQSALSFHGLIPEHVPHTTSVTTGRPARWDTPLGVFIYRHIDVALFDDYALIEVESGRRAYVATPEKALLDTVYLQPGGDDPASLGEMRLQNLDRLDPDRLTALAERLGRPKLRRAARRVVELAQIEQEHYEAL